MPAICQPQRDAPLYCPQLLQTANLHAAQGGGRGYPAQLKRVDSPVSLTSTWSAQGPLAEAPIGAGYADDPNRS